MKYVAVYWVAFGISRAGDPIGPLTMDTFSSAHLNATIAVGVFAWVWSAVRKNMKSHAPEER